MSDLLTQLYAARDFLRGWCPETPSIALVLGSGYATVARELSESTAQVIPYQEIPYFPRCTNPSHPGKLRVGELWGHRVAILQGRIHTYEGYRADQVVFPVRALALWGVKTFLLTNAAGAIHPDHRTGQFMALSDHINLLGQNPLNGENLHELGTRFPDMGRLYDRELLEAAGTAAARADVVLHKGVYAAMQGPSYETPAEIRMLRILGADAVGMSTVPEAIALGHLGRRLFALSCLTNLAAGISKDVLSDDDIVQVLDQSDVQVNLRVILKGVLDAVG